MMGMTVDTSLRATDDGRAALDQAPRPVADQNPELPQFLKMREPDQLAPLLQRVAEADPTSLRRLYDCTSSKLYGVILRIVRDRSDADDVLQDVYLTVWRRADKFDDQQGSASIWLCAIARNRAIDLLRRRPAQSRLADQSELETVAHDAPSTFDRLESSDEYRKMHRVLDQLDTRASWAIRAAFLGGATYGDLALQHGVPLSTMKSRVRRGLLQLRDLMDGRAE